MIQSINGLIPVYASDNSDLGLFTESEVRRFFTRKQATCVERGHGIRAVVAVSLEAEKQIAPRAVRRIQPPQKPWRRQSVGEYRVFQHVAKRCSAYYDGRRLPAGVEVAISEVAV